LAVLYDAKIYCKLESHNFRKFLAVNNRCTTYTIGNAFSSFFSV